jgi:plastocyanin
MKQRVRPVLACLFALTVLGAACTNSSTPAASVSEAAGESSGTITLDGQAANDHGSTDASGGGEFDVEVDSFYFSPTVFTGHPGDELTLSLGNESSTLHNFSLPDQNLDQDIPSDGAVTVKVSFPASGTLVFFCKYHQSQGMVGAFEVE